MWSGFVTAAVIVVSLASIFFALEQAKSVPYTCADTSVLAEQPRPPFSTPSLSDQAMFVAHPVFVGRMRSFGDVSRPIWTFAVVEKHYWGLPWWNRRLIPICGIFRGQQRFVFDGYPHQGLFTKFFPVLIARTCGHTGSFDKQEAQARVLREGIPPKGVRIIGTLRRYSANIPITSAKVVITGPQGESVVVTDDNGVYDVRDVPAGRYRIRTELPDPRGREQDRCGGDEGKLVLEGHVSGCDLAWWEPFPEK
jgi:hypothetical protein